MSLLSARRSFFATVLALGALNFSGREPIRVASAQSIPAYNPCRRWQRRGLELAKRRVRQQGLRA